MRKREQKAEEMLRYGIRVGIAYATWQSEKRRLYFNPGCGKPPMPFDTAEVELVQKRLVEFVETGRWKE